MTPKLILAIILAGAVVAAWIRLILWRRSAPRGTAGASWRFVGLLVLQPVWAALLFLCLFPPGVRIASGAMVIATAGAPRNTASAPGTRLVTLPEAPAIAGAEPAPDLGTALRRHPDIRRITVLGRGMTARDRDAVQGIAIAFDPAPLPPGLVSLPAPPPVAPGASFRIGGQVSGVRGATVDLVDPAGRVTDTQTVDDDGRFIVSGTARSSGPTAFVIRLRDGKRLVEQAEVPILIEGSVAPRLLIMAGAPGPEVKYLRRWASDAGFAVTTRMSAGGGIALGDAPVALDGASLRRFDVAIIDERSWAGLGAGRAAVIAAVRDGLGLVLRSGGDPDTARAQWRSLGFAVDGGGAPAPITLPAAAEADLARTRRGIPDPDAMVDPDMGEETLPEIGRLALTPGGSETAPLLRDAGGATLSAWRAVGRGRIAVFTGIDSFGLILTGRADLYGDWWSTMLSAVSRPSGAVAPAFPETAWVGDRVALCGLPGDARVEAPNGSTATVRVISGGCGAFWPGTAGWHLLRTSVPQGGEQVSPFFVHPPDQLAGVRAARDRDATLLLRNTAPAAVETRPGNEIPGSPWPWFAAWLVLGAALWWLERSRVGRSSARP